MVHNAEAFKKKDKAIVDSTDDINVMNEKTTVPESIEQMSTFSHFNVNQPHSIAEAGQSKIDKAMEKDFQLQDMHVQEQTVQDEHEFQCSPSPIIYYKEKVRCVFGA